MHNEIEDFITEDMLREELAVVEHYLAITPDTPLTTTRRLRLAEEKDQLLQMIEEIAKDSDNDAIHNNPHNTDHNEASSSASLSPSLSPVSSLPPSHTGTMMSGFTTPGLSVGNLENDSSFGFLIDDSLVNGDDRMAQELADWDYAQQIAQRLSDFDSDEFETQRQAQIEADEEFARQLAAAISPFQEPRQQQFVSPQTNAESDDEGYPSPTRMMQFSISQPLHPSYIPPVAPPQLFQSNRPTVQGTPSSLVCKHCSQERGPQDTFCWRCFSTFDDVSGTSPTPGPAQLLHFESHELQKSDSNSYPNIPQSAHSATPWGSVSMSDSQSFLRPSQPRLPQPPVTPPSFPSFPKFNDGWPTTYTKPSLPSTSTSFPPFPHIRTYDYPMPNVSANEIKELLANIHPDDDIKVEDKNAIVPGLESRMRLMKHQQMGLAWMQKMEDSKNKGGLLADEMGLGKTIQSIALLVTRRSDDDKCKTTLICTPVALLRQWYNEIRTKTDPPLKATRAQELLEYDVVLTTYNTIASEWKTKDRYDHAEIRPSYKPRYLFFETNWHRVILDESQVIKNRNTQAARGVFALTAKYRWSLSGTPMQNGIEEMYSQLCYLRVRPYSDWKEFNNTFISGFKRSSKREDSMRKFQALLKAILLRRTKSSKIDGEEILKGLPGKQINMIHAVFDEEESEFYRGLESGAISEMKKYQAAGTLGRNYGNALVLLLRLRQACLHPSLIKEIKKIGSNELDVDRQVDLAREFPAQAIARIKENLTFECPICFEPVLNPYLVLPCGHHYCKECIASAIDKQREDAIARGDETRDKATCPECRGDLDQTRMVSLEVFKTVHCPEKNDNEDGNTSETEEDDGRVFMDNRKRKGNVKEPAICRKKAKIAGKNDWTTSAKIEKLCEILESVRAEDPGEKVIVFSQFTGFLDHIEPALVARNFKYGRYDGGMSARQREEELETFRSDPTKTVCLVSIRAGAYGLNLTCASQCVILDPFWNPFVEAQAIDRVHRIGQMRHVKVHRIVIQETIEDRILALQDKKREIVEGALAEDASKAIARLSAKDLLFLFGISG